MKFADFTLHRVEMRRKRFSCANKNSRLVGRRASDETDFMLSMAMIPDDRLVVEVLAEQRVG